ncbi:Uncharacterised protein [Mycobacteroides abscessus]|nr:Uncharacterised protein [Mycobacteroides abscessus]
MRTPSGAASEGSHAPVASTTASPRSTTPSSRSTGEPARRGTPASGPTPSVTPDPSLAPAPTRAGCRAASGCTARAKTHAPRRPGSTSSTSRPVRMVPPRARTESASAWTYGPGSRKRWPSSA